MKETPLICKPELVKQIIDDNKTHTRRIIKDVWEVMPERAGDPLSAFKFKFDKGSKTHGDPVKIECPYGKPGDLLWVREKFGYGPSMKLLRNIKIHYAADGHTELVKKWKPSIHMPKTHCRLWLKVEEVRVERIQDISKQDCRNEGLAEFEFPAHLRSEFKKLWDSINKKRGYGWNVNPWVWVVVFKKYNRT